ncbi:hypothetical protein GE061_020351, partial [Apolygus lucorum]
RVIGGYLEIVELPRRFWNALTSKVIFSQYNYLLMTRRTERPMRPSHQ